MSALSNIFKYVKRTKTTIVQNKKNSEYHLEMDNIEYTDRNKVIIGVQRGKYDRMSDLRIQQRVK